MIDLRNGDCTQILKTIPSNSIDCIITDPPYELDNHGGTNSALAQRCANVRDNIEFIANGFDYDTVFGEFIRVCNHLNVLIFCSNKQVSKIMSWFEERDYSVTLLVWKKTNPPPLCNGKHISDLEFIVYVREKGAYWNSDADMSYKYKEKRYAIVPSANRNHPTEKPVDLMKELVTLHTDVNHTVLDPFMGSGSTGVACMELNRNFIGIELNEEYYSIASNRMNSPCDIIAKKEDSEKINLF